MTDRRLPVTLSDVQAIYAGPGGRLWELLMGEQIHVNGEADTVALAEKASIGAGSRVLDVCSALGGPARSLARQIGCRVTGLDATQRMVEEATRRTGAVGLAHCVDFYLGDALEMPFADASFDVVFGQDAWCYVTDKARLVAECARVLKPGGTLAFTDWVEHGPMVDGEWEALYAFMAFPYMETLEGYMGLLDGAGLTVNGVEDLSADFATYLNAYLHDVQEHRRANLFDAWGFEGVDDVLSGIALWHTAAVEGKVGRGRFIARK